MKTRIEVQFREKNVVTADVEKLVKADLKANGHKTTALDTLNIYYQPEELKVFYVATMKDGSEVVSEALYIEE